MTQSTMSLQLQNSGTEMLGSIQCILVMLQKPRRKAVLYEPNSWRVFQKDLESPDHLFLVLTLQ